MKTFKKTLALFLATLMIVSACAAYSVFATTNDGGSETVPASEPEAQSEGNTGTATQGWAPDEYGVYHITCLDDFKAFNENATSANGFYKDHTIKLETDLDMSQANWQWKSQSGFRGQFDGGNHTIKNLDVSGYMFSSAAVNAVFKDVKFIGGTVTAVSGVAATIVREVTGGHKVTFENVYVENTIKSVEGTNNTLAAALILRASNTTAGTDSASTAGTVIIKDCEVKSTIDVNAGAVGGFVGALYNAKDNVSISGSVFSGEIKSTGAGCAGFVGFTYGALSIKTSVYGGTISTSGSDVGGFVGRTYANAPTVTLEDCVSTGSIGNNGNYSSLVIGRVITNSSATLTRCVVLGKEGNTSATGWGNLFSKVGGTVTATDCYVVTNNGTGCGSHNGGFANLTITYGGVAIESPSKDSIKKLADSNGSILTAANFKAVCPELAAAGWVVTTTEVTYTDGGLKVPEILPATVATMLGRTLATSPVNAEQWHVKDNGDTVDVRFIGTIKEDADHLAKYDNVGIKITVTEGGTTLINAKKYNSTAVYTSMYTDVQDVDTIIAEDGTYLFSANMRGFKKDATYEVTFIAYATYNGVDILDYDGATTITVVNGAIV